MLSLEKLRKIDPSLADISDSDLEAIRAALYESAQLAFEVYWYRKYGSKNPIRSFPDNEQDGKI